MATGFYEIFSTVLLIAVFYFAYKYNQKHKADMARAAEIICPNVNCGYKGLPKKIHRGSTALGLLLCLFFIVPGILYFMFKSGYRYFCPKCGLQIAADN